MPFSKLGLAPSLCTPLARMGYREPTPVQSLSIPLVLSGSDLLARAQTGTGKTAAFALPMIDRLLVRRRRPRLAGPIGLVLVPTRELAVQVTRALATYGAPVRLRATPYLWWRAHADSDEGAADWAPISWWPPQAGSSITCSAGRSTCRRSRSSRSTKPIACSTWDSCRPFAVCCRPLPQARQTLLFSATLSADVVRLAGEFTRDPQRVDVSHCRSPWRPRSRIASIPSISIASGRCFCTS